jgi:hypothetical protein
VLADSEAAVVDFFGLFVGVFTTATVEVSLVWSGCFDDDTAAPWFGKSDTSPISMFETLVVQELLPKVLLRWLLIFDRIFFTVA